MEEEDCGMHGKWAVTWITIGKPKVQVEEEQRRSKRKRAEDSADQAEAQQAEAQRKQKIIDWVISVLENSPNQHHKRMVIGLCQRGMRQRDSGDPKPKAQPELQPNPEPQPDPVEKPESGADSAVSGAPRCCLGLRFASRAASASTMASTTTSTSNVASTYIWVLKCSRMHLHKFSCYDNVVKSNMFGAPEHNTDFGAFKHLYTLLVNAFNLSQNGVLSENGNVWNKDSKASNCKSNSPSASNGCQGEKERACEKLDESAMGSYPPSLNGASFTLIGFSKGCAVLNQLLFELKEAKKDKNIEAFIKSIRRTYWLDGGHSGGSNTWVTYPEILKEFAQTGIIVHTHVTPYQVGDPMRSWFGKEHKKFVQLLEDFGMQVTS
ncbi:hypothetical protein GW7_09983 [Heterocephalus glaber]|uniref:Uncharacterized protein n=1 Tax=Heterocephalus glaber TaxID=10181 RepID=G5B7W5_HETGA|nr:hypothetical protein GW7_09983 [Heterocephalus glaber]